MTTTFGHAFQPVGPGPKNSGPGPEVRVRGPQKVPGPDLDRTLDSLVTRVLYQLNQFVGHRSQASSL